MSSPIYDLTPPPNPAANSNWFCPKCGVNNLSFQEQCNACGTPNPFAQAKAGVVPQQVVNVQLPASFTIPNRMAEVALTCSILAFIGLPLIGAITGIVLGHISKKEIESSNGTQTGSAMAKAAIVLGIIHLVLCVIGLIVFILFWTVVVPSIKHGR